MNSLLRPRALVVPRNPSWTAEEEVAGDHQSRIANDQAKGTACIQVHTVRAAQGSVCKSQGTRQTHSEARGSRCSCFAFLTFAAVLSRVAGVALRVTGTQVGLQLPSHWLQVGGDGLRCSAYLLSSVTLVLGQDVGLLKRLLKVEHTD